MGVRNPPTQSVFIAQGTFVNDIANGVQAITGVGFAPTFLVIFGGAGLNYAILVADATRGVSLSKTDAVLDIRSTATAGMLQPYTNGANHIHGTFTSLDLDGFTLTWSNLVGAAPARTWRYVAMRF